MPFLENVTRGRNVPRERLEEVAHHYELFGGVSPINAPEPRADRGARGRARARTGSTCRSTSATATGTRSSRTRCGEMRDAGVRRALAFFTSAFSSYSGCRQYREDIYDAQTAVGPDAPEVLKLRTFYNHPGFVEANVDRVRDALARIPAGRRAAAPLVFTAHSIPTAMAEQCRYADQLAETARLVAAAAGVDDYAVVYQSRSGSPAGAVARARTSATTCAQLRARGRLTRRRDLAGRVRLRPRRGAVRPRRRGRRARPASSGSTSCARAPPERIRRSWR